MNHRLKFITGIILLILALTGHFLSMLIALLTSIIIGLLWERKIFRRIGKPVFWFFTIAVTLLAGSFLGEATWHWHGIPISKDGISAGILMNIRAFTVMFSSVLIFSSLSRERILRYSQKLGLEQINPAFEEAIETLPLVKDAWWEARIQENGSILKSIARLLIILQDYSSGESLRRVKIYGITGQQGKGKTYSLEKIGQHYKDQGKKVGGFLQKKVVDDEVKGTTFDLINYCTGESIHLASGFIGRGFNFDNSAFQTAADWLSEDSKKCDILLIDELGVLESKGKGHAAALLKVLRDNPDITIYVTFRKDKLKTLASRFLIAPDNIIDLDKTGELPDTLLIS